MRGLPLLCRQRKGSAAAELALVAPILLAVMFGSVEVGNFFADEHALAKQVRDGARYASRLELATAYSCPSSVFQDADWQTKIINVTKNGVVSGSGSPRWTDYWDRTCVGEPDSVKVEFRCVDKSEIDTVTNGPTGIYTTLPGNMIPVVRVSGIVRYRSVLAALGLNASNLCLRAQSEAAVQGI